ncbi:MAG: type II toxin-antitoxin system RelE/ParE family toxin [Magnetococcales bacterium]|nr:type II toxin-antitoxin system RelE/ParE family toxin [Magnetococcales bacterium]
MKSKIYQHERARRDIIEHFVYLSENAGFVVAERFLTNTEVSFNEMAFNPLIGSPLAMKNQKLAEIRKWHVKDFDNILIFYIPRHDGVSVVRVLHAAQDWWSLLDSTTT